MKIRKNCKPDIKDILAVRTSARDNSFTLMDLADIGITEKSVSDWLDGSIKG